MSKITIEDIKKGIEETENMTNNMVMKKYAYRDEKSLQDVLGRVIRLTYEKMPVKYSQFLSPARLDRIRSMVSDGYFIPGGSILAGLKEDTTVKSSLSNCYTLAIKNDSIESIVDCIKEACRVYSYRGGVGIDITILRPGGSKVNNAASTSSGGVSFVPMISQANATIGANGRRSAMMISLDIRSPEFWKFIWCKSDPYAVFARDNLSQDISARVLAQYVCNKEGLSEEVQKELMEIAKRGKVPEINTANISLRIHDEFMELAKLKDRTTPWICEFPDIEADKDLYNTKWTGDYEAWKALGGKIKHYFSTELFITYENKHRFVNRLLVNSRINTFNGLYLTNNLDLSEEDLKNIDNYIASVSTRITQEWLDERLPYPGTYIAANVVNPTPKEILTEIATATHMRGDPGILFWDKQIKDTTFTHLHPDLKPVTTNPCGELAMPQYSACNLGAHMLSKYVDNPWTSEAKFRMDDFLVACSDAAVFMNMISDINEDLHPLKEQKRMEKDSKRIGIEFTALADMLSMLNLKYGHPEAIVFVSNLMYAKAIRELETSTFLASELGPCVYASPLENQQGLEKLIASDYFTRVVNNGYRVLNADTDKNKLKISQLISSILAHGLRNTAMNTVGPTGTISLVNDNCSSGIEPVFSLFQERFTRVGDKESYYLCHAPVARDILARYEKDPSVSEWTIDEIKERYSIVESDELSATTRLMMQEAVQTSCDGSISSTVNVPEHTTVEEILSIYEYAYFLNLKGITAYRDNSLNSVIKAVKAVEKTITDLVETATPDLPRGVVRKLPEDIPSMRHEVKWGGKSVYLSVGLDENNLPVEIFINNLPREIFIVNGVFVEEDYQEKLSLWSIITRLISVGLRGGISVDVYVDQLRKASFVINDIMSVIIRVLNKYTIHNTSASDVEFKDKTVKNISEDPRSSTCPMCKEKTYVKISGCTQCYNPECGHSTCS